MMLAIIFALAIFLPLTTVSYAIEPNIDEYDDEFDYDSFLSQLDGETVGILNEIGISELSFESVFSVTPSKVFNALFNIVEGAIKEPFKFLMISIGIVMLTSLLGSFVKKPDTIQLVGGGAVALTLAVPVATTVSEAFSVLELLGIFTSAFSGVFCAVVSASGGVVSGASYGAMTIFFNGLFSGGLSAISKPVINSMCALGFLSSFDMMKLTQRFSEIVKKIYLFLISFVGTVFSGMVTLKGVLSESADNLASRSVRFVVGRSLPIVGGAVSETYSALISSLSLIKSTVGAFGIITVIVIALPTVIKLAMWILSLEISLSLFGAFGADSVAPLFKTVKDALLLLMATIIMITTIFVVSVGVVISIRGAGA